MVDDDSERLNRILSAKKFSIDECEIKDHEQAEDTFNHKLIQYVCEWENVELKYSGKELNLGHNAIESEKITELSPVKKNRIKRKVRWMMNAKPDIAVIYRIGESEQRVLMFLECKFESKEDYYLCNAEEKSEKNYYKQTEIQWRIADFLCKYLEMKRADKVKMVDRILLNSYEKMLIKGKF